MKHLHALKKDLSSFEVDVLDGLTSKPKYLPSKYFYDEAGDKLFQKIMDLNEYYPTRCEKEIMQVHKQDLQDLIAESGKPFDLIELGAGDGKKTKIILKYFVENGIDFTYYPVDISGHIIDFLQSDLRNEIPQLKIEGIAAEYFEALNRFFPDPHRRKVILLMGASVGNFSEAETIQFFREISNHLSVNDLFVVGFDLKKDPDVILNAYNDSEGVTRAFNMNLLQRINNELDGDFDLSHFKHFPNYCPVTGDTKSYLVSTKAQKVHIGKIGLTVDFNAWEPIFTEVSKKYDHQDIMSLASASGFMVTSKFLDSRQYFANYVFMKLSDKEYKSRTPSCRIK